jgi:hypothetical protein
MDTSDETNRGVSEDVGGIVPGTPVAFVMVGDGVGGALVTPGLVVTTDGGTVVLGGVVPGELVEGAAVGATGVSVVPDAEGWGVDTGVDVGAVVPTGLPVGTLVTAGLGATETEGGCVATVVGAIVGVPGGATQHVVATALLKKTQEALLNMPSKASASSSAHVIASVVIPAVPAGSK